LAIVNKEMKIYNNLNRKNLQTNLDFFLFFIQNKNNLLFMFFFLKRAQQNRINFRKK